LFRIIFVNMKIAVKIIIFIFFIFLSTPTIVSLIEKAIDTSCFYSLTEEEISQKEIKSDFLVDTQYPVIRILLINKIKIYSFNNLRHDSISSKIFIPPPQQI